MPHDQEADAHLHQLRKWRNPREAGFTMREENGFDLRRYFVQNLEKPHKQLAAVAPLWDELVPGHLSGRTTLISFARQVLTVHVPDSSTLYQLDRALRSGLERELRTRCRAPLKRVMVRVASEPSAPKPPEG